MNKLKQSDIHIAYDNDIGIVYHVRKGKIKITDSSHAARLKTAVNCYFSNTLTLEEAALLETYIYKEFQHHPEREVFNKRLALNNTKKLNQLEIIVATDCNLKCKYCYADNGTYGREKRVLQPEDATLYLRKLLVGRYENIDVVMFFGGEPTIQPQTIEAICTFFKNCVHEGIFNSLPVYTMVSNGTLIDNTLAQLLAKHKIRVTISIDGPKDINDVLRVTAEGEGTYDAIASGIAALQNAGSGPHAFEATYTSTHREKGYTKAVVTNFLKDEFSDVPVLIEDCVETRSSECCLNNDSIETSVAETEKSESISYIMS